MSIGFGRLYVAIVRDDPGGDVYRSADYQRRPRSNLYGSNDGYYVLRLCLDKGVRPEKRIKSIDAAQVPIRTQLGSLASGLDVAPAYKAPRPSPIASASTASWLLTYDNNMRHIRYDTDDIFECILSRRRHNA
ncbi:hypothetical protein Trydic_g42 [Trypoxylus dichotomus]